MKEEVMKAFVHNCKVYSNRANVKNPLAGLTVFMVEMVGQEMAALYKGDAKSCAFHLVAKEKARELFNGDVTENADLFTYHSTVFYSLLSGGQAIDALRPAMLCGRSPIEAATIKLAVKFAKEMSA